MGTPEGQDSEFGGEARGRVWYAARLERLRHGCGEPGALERVTLLQLGVGGDNCPALGTEVAAGGRKGRRGGVECPGHCLQWRGRGRGGGDPVREQLAERVLADEQNSRP
jgi:hypothetical protein